MEKSPHWQGQEYANYIPYNRHLWYNSGCYQEMDSAT